MESTKRILTKKKLLSKSSFPEKIEKISDKQNERNPHLSESGATTTSSVSSNTKNKDVNGKYKTPKKNIFQNFKFPIKKNVNTVSPNDRKNDSKIYSKGVIKNIPQKINNNINVNDADKQYNRSMSLISIDNNLKNNTNNENENENNIQKNGKKKNIYFIKKIKNKNFGNKKLISSHLNTTNINNNIFSESEKDLVKTELKKSNQQFNNFNNLNLTVSKNLEENYFNNEERKGYYSEAEKKFEKKEKSCILNLEELLMTEEKLSAVINCIQDKKQCAEECFEWMNSYIQSDLISSIEKFFVKEQFIKIIKISININIFSLILCYVISLNESIFEKLNINLLELMKLNHSILILICKYFSNKIVDKNIWVIKLNQLISSYDPFFKNTVQIFREINIYCNYLVKLIPIILTYYSRPDLISIYNILENISSHELILIYREKYHKNINQNGSIFASSAYFVNNKIMNANKPKSPFLKIKSNKAYTLVLDLDETLIHFKPNPNNESCGKIMIRPYLYDFLKNVKKYYELIIFTAATQDYADPIINAIEKDEKFFEYRLYRIHTTIIENDFVKDLSKLGRDLNKTIIVDNMKQNYKNQPYNGITIRPFWGKDVDDTALVDLLDILKKIAENNMDVISGLKYYKEDIISKVSSNILRRAQNK